MTVKEALELGAAAHTKHFGEPLKVDGFLESFICWNERVRYGNSLEAGGFMPDADAVLHVPYTEFAKVGLTPFPGMRITVKARPLIVTSIESGLTNWLLTTTQAFPKDSDMPCFIAALATNARQPILFNSGLLEPR